MNTEIECEHCWHTRSIRYDDGGTHIEDICCHCGEVKKYFISFMALFENAIYYRVIEDCI